MSYTSLITYVDIDGAPPEKRVRLAASLADRFRATLTGVSAVAIPDLVVANGMVVPTVAEDDIKLVRAKLADRGAWFRNLVNNCSKVEWRPFLELPSEVLPREALNADLVIIGQKPASGAYVALDPGEVILQMGRPTLIVPNEVGSLQAEHVVIGWKDTREARRALADALPFLHDAARVTIVQICDSEEERIALERIDEVARFLGRHRIKAGPRVIVRKEGTGAAQLIRLAQDDGADLLVTGAYGHSRLGEWIFGGMTRDLLATSPFCCLMSH